MKSLSLLSSSDKNLDSPNQHSPNGLKKDTLNSSSSLVESISTICSVFTDIWDSMERENKKKKKKKKKNQTEKRKEQKQPKTGPHNLEFTSSQEFSNHPLSIPPPQDILCSMQESPAANNQMISQDRLLTSKDFIPKECSSKIQAVDSTTTEKEYAPWWNNVCQVMSKKWWLPTEIACVALDSNSSSGYLQSLMSNSWFSPHILQNSCSSNLTNKTPTSWWMTSSPSPTITWPEITDFVRKQNEERDKVLIHNKNKYIQKRQRLMKYNALSKEEKQIHQQKKKRVREEKEIEQQVKKQKREEDKKKKEEAILLMTPEEIQAQKKEAKQKQEKRKTVKEQLECKEVVLLNAEDLGVKEPAEGCRKHKVYFTRRQLKVAKIIRGHHTFIRNKCIDVVIRGSEPGIVFDAQIQRVAPETLAPLLVNDSSPLVQKYPFLKNLLYDIRYNAVEQFVEAYKSNLTKCQGNVAQVLAMDWKKIGRHTMHRSLKVKGRTFEKDESWGDRYRCWSFLKSYFLQQMGKQKKENLCFHIRPPLEKVDYDCHLGSSRSGEWYLYVPHALRKSVQKEEEKKKKTKQAVVSIDPGIRTWCTLYDPQGQRIEQWGHETSNKQYALCKWMDWLLSLIDRWKNEQKKPKHERKQVYLLSVSKRVRKRMKKEKLTREEEKEYLRRHQTSQILTSRLVKHLQRHVDRLRARIRNLTRDFHYRLSNYCCAGFELTCYPTFDSTSIASTQGGARKINKKSVRNMMNWSPGLFFKRLEHVRRRYDSLVYHEDEKYTTKGCTRCGALNHNVGGSKVYQCVNPDCALRIGRDDASARMFGLKCMNSIVSSISALE